MSATVQVRDLETLPEGWKNVYTMYQNTAGKRFYRYEILSEKTGLRYLSEPVHIIARKCALLIFYLPIYFSALFLFESLRLVCASVKNLSFSIAFKQVFKLVSLPIYLIGLEFAAVYGIFSPLDGRVLYGSIERDLHEGRDLRRSYQKYRGTDSGDQELIGDFLAAITEEEVKTMFFSAACMQSYGKKDDPHILLVEILD